MDALVLILLFAAIILSVAAQIKVKGTFRRYSGVPNRLGITGAAAARRLLAANGVRDVRVEPIHGTLTDHYDPKARVVRLSEGVYDSASLSALGVAAHETGHALQHAEGYFPLTARGAIFPVVSFGSKLAFPLIFIGFIITSLSGVMGRYGIALVYIGIIMYAAVVAFQVITLPVEFNASARAIALLEDDRVLSPDEIPGARKVLFAAALTYVAAAAVALLQLLRLILAARRSD
ncbi:MAG: zinc metallopeptidase [Clostridiales bacterium]|jgi:Zn-dependent membrane protease YugP|nr:zinc metallopeptidase [Clostridiales bacterium]